ncbi:MAG: glycosyltransferase family 4 protein [Nitrospira sp.]|jgi:UDP-N-acetylmuramyl pentapeptide phosphotransferase/UDP-N-acetylglucosamine-1-phosphate transferase|nr:glycosyltransferase family 4 protein [Nitrospira sp.]
MMLWGGVVISGFVAWWLTGQLAGARFALSVLDHPNERSLHNRPTPRTGGVAILAGLLFGLAWMSWGGTPWKGISDLGLLGWPAPVWIVLLTYGIGLVSFVDDRGGVPVSVRFGIHLLAATMLVVGAGLRIPALSLPVVGAVDFGWLAVPLSIGFLVWMTNLYNFMDGMDGFAGGMTVVGGGFLAWFGWSAGLGFLFVTAVCAVAAAIGFLLHNFPPARIFMGDVGSVSLGFLFGSLMLLGVHDRVFDFWVPIMLFSPFIVDATVTLIRRSLQGERIWQAHRSHYYQRLVLLGWGHRKTVLAEYGLMVLCGLLAWGYHMADVWTRWVVLGFWGVVVGLAMLGVHQAEQRVLPARRDAGHAGL